MKSSGTADSIRLRIAQVVWLAFVVCALFLAVGALCIALDANRDNSLVKLRARRREPGRPRGLLPGDGIKEFTGANAETKDALFNWGLGAVAWLVVGRIVERVIRP